jgi:serine/threonine-protein kinase HipA
MMYPSACTVEVHHAGAWHPAGELLALGPNQARFAYHEAYVFGGPSLPVSLALPVGLGPVDTDKRPPAFVYDLVPQGRGRKFLLSALALPDSDEMVLPLVMAGAFNPVGCIRMDCAVAFYQQQAAREPDAQVSTGFSLQGMREHSQAFLDHIALHAMLAAGTTGVQGVAPKFLLTTDAQGQWFADLALPDDQAREHWLVKLPRGRSDEDRLVLRNEAAYLRVAAACGLRTHAEPMLMGEMLFVRRFDRVVDASGVHRLHQESLASLVGQRGFGVPHSQQALLQALRAVATDPLAETIEFIQRDVLNLALRNTDNHARNTAVQRTPDGRIQLTPVFDFAPMFKDPEVVVRSCHWRDAHGVRQDIWREVIAQLPVPDAERSAVAQALVAFASTVAALAQTAGDCGVEKPVLDPCLRSIEQQAEQLLEVARG